MIMNLQGRIGVLVLVATTIASAAPVWAQTKRSLLSADARARHEAMYIRCRECRVSSASDATPRRRAADARGATATGGDAPGRVFAPGSLVALAVVEGTVTAVEPLSTGGGHVFTAYALALTRVVKASTLAPHLAAGVTIIVTRPGGTIATRDGWVDVEVAGGGPLAVGTSLDVALLPLAGTDTFQETVVPASALAREGVRR